MRTDRIAKTLNEKVQDLDSYLYLLREHRLCLSESRSHLKDIAAELRALVCSSARTEGLLWRLVDELKVDDRIFVHAPGKLRRNHPMAQGLKFYAIPIMRGGKGNPKLPPANQSFKHIIKNCESIFADGKPLTYEYLIKAIAQQMGSAHEDDGLEPVLAELRSIILNGLESFVQALYFVTDYTLEVGERVLDDAEKKLGFKRTQHKYNYGDVSLILRLRIKQQLAGRVPLVVFHSYVSDAEISCYAGPSGVSFAIKKKGQEIDDITAKYPPEWQPGAEAVFILSYCSSKKQARTITNNCSSKVVNVDELGWLHASDMILEHNNTKHIDIVEKKFLLSYERLLSSEDAKGLYDLPSNGYGLWKYSNELENQSPFPE